MAVHTTELVRRELGGLLPELLADPAEFRARWGREMAPGDPLIPDWDAAAPTPMAPVKLAAAVRTLRSVLQPPASLAAEPRHHALG